MIKEDISTTFSGGSSNFNPEESLGGDPSVHPANRLFNDIDKNQAITGKTDYRCVYLNNDNATQDLQDAILSIVYTQDGDSIVELGVSFANDIQSITVTNTDLIVSGYMELIYTDDEEHSVLANWDASLDNWTDNIQNALRTIENLEDVTVASSEDGTTVIFEITFGGSAGNRNHQILQIENNLLPSGVNTAIAKITNGSPINNSTDEIDVETTPPFNLTFTPNSIEIGNFRPNDTLPIWIKRTVPANSSVAENDGFTLRVQGTSGV